MKRAYSLFEIKSVNEDERVIEGIASTPSPDRLGDIVEPMGAQFSLPIPLLWQHDSATPIGSVTFAKASPDGIMIRAKVEKIDEPGTLKDRLDEAWQSLKYKLVRGLSIGFTPLESARIKDTWSEHFLKWDWLELSCVTIPANAQATITTIKTADQATLAASGVRPGSIVRLATAPGDSGHVQSIPKKELPKMKTIAEQIAAFEAKRAASMERMNAIMSKASEDGRTLDEAETEEYDGLKAEVDAVDKHLTRLKDHERQAVATAKAVTRDDGADPDRSSAVRAGTGVISVKSNVEKGIAFTRYVKALAMARGSLTGALAIAENNKSWQDETPQVAVVLKAAVAGGDTTSAGWAAELVYNQDLVAEFIELLRPQTIIGRLPGLTRVPFNVRMSGQDSGTTAYWVGQGKPVPLSKLNTLEVTLGIAKAAGMVVLTEELVRSSSPSAEMLVRNDLTKSIAQFLDVQFIAPDYAAVANVSPASITNGVTPTAATGTNTAAIRTDVKTLFSAFIANNLDPTGAVWIMTNTQALALSLIQNALGQQEFPSVNMNGGTWFGYPVIASQSAAMVGSPFSGEGQLIVLANTKDILLADDGGITIDASREASLEMLDNPTNSAAAGTATSMVSMFQTNSVAIRAVRFINWKKRRSTAVNYIKDAAYVGG